MDTAISLNYN